MRPISSRTFAACPRPPLSGMSLVEPSAAPSSYLIFTTAETGLSSGPYPPGHGGDQVPGGGPRPGGRSQLGPWFWVTPTLSDKFAISEIQILYPRVIQTVRPGLNRFSQFQKGRDADVNPAKIG